MWGGNCENGFVSLCKGVYFKRKKFWSTSPSWWKSVGLGGPRWHVSSWQRGIAESRSSRLLTLMIDIPGDLVWGLPCMQQAIYLEGGPLIWMLPLYLQFNQKPNDDDDDDDFVRGVYYKMTHFLLWFVPFSISVPLTKIEYWTKRLAVFRILVGTEEQLHHCITKTRLFKYIENFTSKNGKFSDKNSDTFLIFLLRA